jgi:3-oxoacyl-(acyl-carrier-protein) synthase III
MSAVGIAGIGAHLPDQVIDNSRIANWCGAEEEWVEERTGISGRRYASGDTVTSDLAHAAVLDLFASCPVGKEEVGLLVLATSTPDQPQPATAAILHHKLGLSDIPAFDVNAVCSGFVYAVAVAAAMLGSGGFGRAALVVGAEMYSTIMNRADRRTVSLFGDGAGAVLLASVPDGYGFLATRLATHSDHWELVEVIAGGTREPADERARAACRHLFQMDGRAVLDYAQHHIPKIVDEALSAAGVDLDDVDRVVMHQGNTRMVELLAKELGIGMDRIPLTAPEYGNTGAASIPITLHAANARRPFERGERVLLVTVGGGMTVGASVLVWY